MKNKNKGINVLSLFDGMSCGQVALERSGVKVNNYFASEIDGFAIRIAQKNYPKTIQLGDISKISYFNGCLVSERKISHVKIDLVIGGSPCQSFSNSGDGTGFEGKSKLFWDYVRILDEIKAKNPKVKFLLENVNMKREWSSIISTALKIDFISINSKIVSAQNRPRLYWTNILDFSELKIKHLDIKLKEVLLQEDEIPNNYFLSKKAVLYMDGLRNGKQRWEYHKNTLNGLASCLTSNMFKGVPYGVIKEMKRRLTPIECERLQTLNDDYTKGVSDSQRLKMIGNGWTVNVIVEFFKHLEK